MGIWTSLHIAEEYRRLVTVDGITSRVRLHSLHYTLERDLADRDNLRLTKLGLVSLTPNVFIA